MLRRIVLFSLLATIASSTNFAAPPGGDQALDLSKIAMAMKGGGPPSSEDESPFPKFEDVTKDMESAKGLFTLWSYPSGAKDKDAEKLLCQIPASFLGEKFMLSVSFSGGGFFTGFPLEERVVKWAMLDKQLVLVEPETRFVVDKSHTVSDVVTRTYPESIRVSVPIVTKSPQGDPVIDLGGMLKSSFADIGWMSMGPMMPFRGAGGGVNPALSQWTTKKTFELNVEIGVELAMSRMSPPGSYDKKMVHFSFWKLPDSNYTPRVADDRVGYFITANQDWAKPTDARDLFNRYVDRWQLEKRDPSLAVCEPKQPIIYYIEKTVPVKFRRAVRDGIAEWNKAFEKVGFVNAVEVRQQTDDNEWKDLDPEDMRYSFFRWIVTGAGFAMGPHRANPFTGQIYDADIIFDDSMVRYYEQSAQQYLPSALVESKTNDPAVTAFLQEHPQFKRPMPDLPSLSLGETEESGVRDAMRERMRRRGFLGCDYYEGMKHQMAVAHAVLAGQPPEVIDRFLYEVIREVVMHEVGHTLGLRHNFKASSIYSLEEIKKRRGTGEPLVGSVMDYNPTLFFLDKPVEGRFITPTIGPYDYWAIEYGYRPADGFNKGPESGEDEKKPADEDGKDAKVASSSPTEGPMGKIPPEVLEKLPPELRKMIEDKAGEMALAIPPNAKGKRAGGPAFKGAPAGEADMLKAIAARAAEPELAYATDEDTTGYAPDPRSNRFDMGADPIEWARERIKLADQRMNSLLEWGAKDAESWYFLRKGFVSLLVERMMVLDYVGRYIGGQNTSRSHRGDPDAQPPFAVVDAELQRRALAFTEENAYQDSFFSFPPELLNHLAAPRWYHAGASTDFVVDFPIRQWIGVLQWFNLVDRLFPNNLRRIHDNELRSNESNKLTAAEYLQRMQKACWSDVLDPSKAADKTWSDTSPFLSSIRRSLQREYLNLLEPLVRTAPGTVLSPDLHAMVQASARRLGDGISKTLDKGGSSLDFASEAHLTACKSRIERMLKPELKEYGLSGM